MTNLGANFSNQILPLTLITFVCVELLKNLKPDSILESVSVRIYTGEFSIVLTLRSSTCCFVQPYVSISKPSTEYPPEFGLPGSPRGFGTIVWPISCSGLHEIVSGA